MILNSPYISGSLTVTGNIVTSGSITVTGGISGSSAVSASQAQNAVSASYALTASYASNVPLTASFAISASYALNTSNATSSSYALNASTATSASQAQNANNAISSSFASNSNLLNGIDSTRFAVTSSNSFTGTQYIADTTNPTGFGTSAALYTDGGLRVTKDAYVSGTIYVNNLTVYGTQSINYVTSSQLNIGTNIISVNTDTPSVRFGGLAVYDSGSTGLTGSILWDSEDNHWVYSNPSGSVYDSALLIAGPKNSSGLGNEQGINNNAIVKGQGGDHVTSSAIIENGTLTSFYTNALSVSSSGDTVFGNTITNTHQFTGSVNITGSLNTRGSINNALYDGGSSSKRWSIGDFTTDTNYNTLELNAYTEPRIYFNTNGGGNLVLFNSYGNIGLVYSSGSYSNNILYYDHYYGRNLSIQAGGATRMFISGSGNIGIGTTSPVNKFEIASAAQSWNTSPSITFTDTSGDASSNRWIVGNIATTYGTFNIASAPTPTSTTYTSRLSILSNGYVGIGTTIPDRPLIVNGDSIGLYGSTPALVFKNTASSDKRWDISISGTEFRINETGVAQRMAILAGGNVGIGVTPSAWSTVVPMLQIGAGGAFMGGQGSANILRTGVNAYYDGSNWRYINSSYACWAEAVEGGFRWFGAASGTAGATLSPSELMRIATNGNVGIGTNSPTYKLVIAGTTSTLSINPHSVGIDLHSTGNFAPHYQTNFTWYTGAIGSGTQKANLDSSGNLTISGILTESSSIRYKTNIETVKYGLDKILQLRGVTYDKKDTGIKELGLIAEEVNEILPDVVIKNEEGEPDSVSYGRLTAVLIEAVKDLQAQINELKGK